MTTPSTAGRVAPGAGLRPAAAAGRRPGVRRSENREDRRSAPDGV